MVVLRTLAQTVGTSVFLNLDDLWRSYELYGLLFDVSHGERTMDYFVIDMFCAIVVGKLDAFAASGQQVRLV